MMIADAAGARPYWLAFLREELSARPGRGAAVARITASCAIVVTLWMVFEIPLPAYAAYVVFLVSGTETASTLMTAVGGLVAATSATALTLVLFAVDASEPALRIPLMAGATFLGMYLSRIITVGPIAFLAGFVLVIDQTLVDDIPDPEALTRFVLWLWLVVAVPTIVVAVLDLAIGQNPKKLLLQRTLKLLDDIAFALENPAAPDLRRLVPVAASLADLHQRAELVDRRLRMREAIDLAFIESLDELVRLAALLDGRVPADVRHVLAALCRQCRMAVASGTVAAYSHAAVAAERLEAVEASARPLVVALGRVLGRMMSQLEALRQVPAGAAPRPARKALLVPDAFSNPDHARFAIKVAIAATAAYIVYSGLDWPGIRTSVVTCFFVALSSVGASVHKLNLRIAGALTGGLVAGLCLVYVIPSLTDIGQLLVLLGLVTAASAWVATSSERLAYAGMQIAFAFYVGVLQGYGPADDLTVLRDRVAGIVLGNVLISVIFVSLWPVSAAKQARIALANAAKSLADMLRHVGDAPSTTRTGLAVARAFNAARQQVSVSAFETAILADRSSRSEEQKSLRQLESIAAAVYIDANARPTPAANAATIEAAAWLEHYAEALQSNAPAPPGSALDRASLPRTDPASPIAAAADALLLASLRADSDEVARAS